MSNLICLGGGIEGLPILERAKALGHRLIVVDANPNAPGFALADERVIASCYAPNCWRTKDGLPHTLVPDGVLCCAVDAPNVAAAVAQKFNLPGLTPAQAYLSVDKLAQKTALRAAGVDVPNFHGWERVVVKPPASRGARGVKLIDTGGVVEEYLPGPQLSTESIVQDGHVLFTGIAHRNYDRLQEFAPYIIEDGFEEPYGDLGLRTAVDQNIREACRVLGWYQQGGGTVKADLILNEGRVVVLELAARLSGGFLSTHGHPLAYNFPFVDVAIDLALGHKQGVVDTSIWHLPPGTFVCQRYVFPQPDDIGRRVSQQAYISDHNDSDFSTYAIHPGDTIKPVVSHAERWGQAICTGATPEQAQERAERAVAAMYAAVVLE